MRRFCFATMLILQATSALAGPCPPFCSQTRDYQAKCAPIGQRLTVPGDTQIAGWIADGGRFCAIIEVAARDPK